MKRYTPRFVATLAERLQDVPPEKRIVSDKEWAEIHKRLERIALLRSIRGKYAHLTTSSEAFAARKAEEIELEG